MSFFVAVNVKERLLSFSLFSLIIATFMVFEVQGSALKSNFSQFGQRISSPISQIDNPIGAESSPRRVKKLNETKSSASYDSFRVLTPEQEPNGLLLVNSYHDFR